MKSLHTKMLQATERELLAIHPTEGGFRIICNAGTYEHLKKELLEFYDDYKTYEQLHAVSIHCHDRKENDQRYRSKSLVRKQQNMLYHKPLQYNLFLLDKW